MNTKKLLVAGGLTLAAFTIYGFKKVESLKAVFDRMTIKPTRVSSIKVDLNKVSFNIDILIENPTNTGFALTGASIASLKRIMVYRDGVSLGTVEVNMQSIDIAAYSSAAITNLPFTISTESVLYNLITASSFDMNKLKIIAIVGVLGAEYVIEN